jgi:hypothetical protein
MFLDTSACGRVTEQLLADMSGVFQVPDSIVTSEALVRRIGLLFDDETRYVRRMLSEHSVEVKQQREDRISGLTAFSADLLEFRSALKQFTDSALAELEREQFDAAATRDQEERKLRASEQRLRALQTKRDDVAGRRQHQQAELESIGQLVRELEESRADYADRKAEALRRVEDDIGKEIELLRVELNRGSDTEARKVVAECGELFNSVRDGLRDELCEMEMVERWAVSRLRSPIRKPPAPRVSPRTGEQPLIRAAQERMRENRKQREMAMVDIQDNLRALGQEEYT